MKKSDVSKYRSATIQTDCDAANDLFVKTYSKKLGELSVIAEDKVMSSPESEAASISLENTNGRSVRAAKGIL